MSFVVDKAIFYRSDSLAQVEIYYMLDPKTLGDSVYSLSVSLKRKGSKQSPVSSQWNKRVTQKGTGMVVDYFNLFVKPGEYEVNLKIQSKNARSGETVLKFSVPKPPEIGPYLSDIELAYKFLKDSTSIFYKHGVAVIPDPGAQYVYPKDTMAFYFEVYGLVKDTGVFVVNVLIQDKSGNAIKRLKPKIIKKMKRNSAPWADLIYLGDLKSGAYILLVQVIDLSNGKNASKEKEFYYSHPELKPPKLSFEVWKYLEFIDYFASASEMKSLKSIKDPEKKKMFLWRFWQKFDPYKDTPENEFLKEFVKRVKYADENFSIGKRRGRYTDRGRIYIKYGPPDRIEKKLLQFGARDMEKWVYFKRGGMEFIFVDIEGFGDYKLVYSSIPEEPTLPDWKKYVQEESNW